MADTPRLFAHALPCWLLAPGWRLPQGYPLSVEYPTVDEVVAMYCVRFNYPPDPRIIGLQARRRLQAALLRPANYVHYEGADFAKQVAVLAHAISEGQFFPDGNKRLAYVVTKSFLDAYGFQIVATRTDFTSWMVMLSEPEEGEKRARWDVERFDSVLRRWLVPNYVTYGRILGYAIVAKCVFR